MINVIKSCTKVKQRKQGHTTLIIGHLLLYPELYLGYDEA